VTGPLARLLSLAIFGLGVAMVVSTVVRGGGPLSVGVVVGLLFCALGAARLYVEVRR
jgi:hypothetical protein